MLIGSPQMIKNISNSQPNILTENKPIQEVNKCKTLGTTIDQRLTWKPNTENICQKITSGLSALRRIKPFVADRDTIISIYNAIIRPYFDYCSEVWDVFGDTQSKLLKKLQNRAPRIITDDKTVTIETKQGPSIDVTSVEFENNARISIIKKLGKKDNLEILNNLFTKKGISTNPRLLSLKIL